VAEETEGSNAGTEASSAVVDPAAVALALGGASRERADAFLKKQEALVDLQARELAHELGLRHWSLWVRHASALLKLALELSAGLLLLGVVAGMSLMVWNAAHADGLIIEGFSVPLDMAGRGVTGQAVASQILDKLTAMQNATTSVRSAKSYTNNWGDDLKVEIPDTGVSIGEAYRFLRGWLGHETHISGEIYRTGTGVAITARTDGESGATYTGPETDLDALTQKAAEHVYSVTQPYRYGWFLRTHLRVDEAKAVLRQLAANSGLQEQAWAWHGLAILFSQSEGNERAAEYYDRRAIALNPDFSIAYYTLGREEITLGHTEAALHAIRTGFRLVNIGYVADITASQLPAVRVASGKELAFLLGDYVQAADLACSDVDNYINALTPDLQRRDLAIALAHQHDAAGAREVLRDMPPEPRSYLGDLSVTRLEIDVAFERWQAVVASERLVEKAYIKSYPADDLTVVFGEGLRPLLALAKARMGDPVSAAALISSTPADCYNCVVIRGQIADAAKQHGRADYWFARAVHDGPSIPFAYTDWGQSLLARGKSDDAIEKFRLANQKGPHFADPLEMWGEALMAKNQSHLALAKFAEAEKYAPNWGRLHMKWGEALVYAGKKDEAKEQFSHAAALDLTPSEKSELARHP
jgi:tetratricopeptide (TPR) repeat protein